MTQKFGSLGFWFTHVLPAILILITGLTLHLSDDRELGHYLIATATSYLLGGATSRLTTANPGPP